MPRLEGLGMLYGGCLGITYGLGYNGLAHPDTHSTGAITDLDAPQTILGLSSDVAATLAAVDGPSGVWIAVADAVKAAIAAQDEAVAKLLTADQWHATATEDEPTTEIGTADEAAADIQTTDRSVTMIEMADEVAAAIDSEDN